MVANNQLILERLGEGEINAFIIWLKRNREPNYLNFLADLCVCNNT